MENISVGEDFNSLAGLPALHRTDDAQSDCLVVILESVLDGVGIPYAESDIERDLRAGKRG